VEFFLGENEGRDRGLKLGVRKRVGKREKKLLFELLKGRAVGCFGPGKG